MTIRAVIFDFDGTLVDSFEATRLAANALAPELGFRTATREEAQLFRTWPYRKIADHIGLPMYKVPIVAARVRKEMKRTVPQMRPVEGLVEVLVELRARGATLGILTSNSRDNVDGFLSANGIDSFHFVHTARDVWGKGRRLEKLLKKRGLTPREVAYVGDEVRDIEASRTAAVRAVAVGWGYSAPELLASHAPDAVIRRPEELLEAVASS